MEVKVIVTEPFSKYNTVGEIVTVKGGYARNYLIPKGKALPATSAHIADFEQRKAEIEKEQKERFTKAQELLPSVTDKVAIIIQQAGEDGRLFGSIRPKNIAEALSKESGIEIKNDMVQIDGSAKYLGVYAITVKLFPGVEAKAYINVARTEEEAQEAWLEFLNPKKEKAIEAVEEEIVPEAEEAGEQEEQTEEDASQA